ncbi:MAG: hypothetical protein KJ587_18335 [Alphaproteobacteria bacterium]|nr:hypothetical protein [Alphaproteobacteria bacterium]
MGLQFFDRGILDHTAGDGRMMEIARIEINIPEIIERALVAMVGGRCLQLADNPVEHFIRREQVGIAVAVEML